MGDLIHAIAAVSALRAALPECKIGWVVEKRWSELLCAPGFASRGERSRQRPLVDDLFTLDIRALRSNPFSPAIWKEMRALLRRAEIRRLRARRRHAGCDPFGADCGPQRR